MKKALIVVVVILLGLGVWFFAGRTAPSSSSQSVASNNKSNGSTGQAQGVAPLTNPSSLPPGDTSIDAGTDDEGIQDTEDRPATELYKSADEALKAIRDGAADYDDVVLEQFTQLGEDCTWCPAFYQSVKDLLAAPDTTSDQRSYFAEVLAVSGRVDNIQTLVQAIKGAKNQDEADAYSEALELTIGKDDVVNYLASELQSSNDSLKESVVAAITNQGSLNAANVLYKHTTEKGDPDGYYALGIGLGEFIPEPEALPFFQELVQKRDQYSHLAVKALLNDGIDGVRIVFDSLGSSKDPVFDRQMLKDAIDHVNYEEETEAYLKKIVETSKSEVSVEFAKQILSDFNLQDQETDEEEG